EIDAALGEHAARLVERQAVAVEQLLEQAGVATEPLRLRRRTPLPPLAVAEVDEEARHHHGEIRAQRAAPLELPQDRVVPLDQSQPHVGLELVLLLDAEPVTVR